MRNLSIAVVAVVLVAGSANAQTPAEQRAILRDFERAVAVYVDRLECSGAPLEPTQTVIFTLPVSMVFRQLIAAAMGDPSIPTMSAPRRPFERHLEACESFPLAESTSLPEVVADVLPALPAGMEYRFVGHDLLLRDVERNVIAGVLRHAIRSARTTTHIG